MIRIEAVRLALEPTDLRMGVDKAHWRGQWPFLAARSRTGRICSPTGAHKGAELDFFRATESGSRLDFSLVALPSVPWGRQSRWIVWADRAGSSVRRWH
jgi:hypothetical protein